MKKKTCFAVLAVALSAGAFGAGFGLYEMDAKSTGMGGNVLGKPTGPSTIFYNPAGMSCLTGTCVYVGATMLYPPVPYRVYGGDVAETDGRLDPGAYVFPTAFITQELPWGFTAGLGFYADFGLGSRYDDDWALKYDSTKSEFQAFTINPAISYQITDRWSVGGGLRLTYVSFMTDQTRNFNFADLYGVPNGFGGLYNYGLNHFHLQADNARNLALGFNLGTRYRLTDDISLGAMYRSPMRTRLQGEASWTGAIVGGGRHNNSIEDTLNLPQQATIGFNWEHFLLEDLELGMSASWIGWSCMEKFSFDVYNPTTQEIEKNDLNLNWRDTVRVGLGFCYAFNENWDGLLGYVFDKDPSSDSLGNAHTMLPPGDRHVISFGGAWHTADRSWEISVTYAPIIMQHSCAAFKSEYGNQVRYMDTTASCTHCVCAGVMWRF